MMKKNSLLLFIFLFFLGTTGVFQTGCQLFRKPEPKTPVSAFEEPAQEEKTKSEQEKMAEFVSSARKQKNSQSEKTNPGDTFLMSSQGKDIYHNLDR